MANWTMAFQDRTDGVAMLGGININMVPIDATGKSYSSGFSTGYYCYTSDNKFTVNDNAFTVQNDDGGSKADGGATVTIKAWTPNSAQMDDIKKLPGIKKYKYFFNSKISNFTANHVIVTFNPNITVDTPTPPPPVEKKYNLLDAGWI